MTFETEYQLEQFREIESQYNFGSAYTGVFIPPSFIEQILKLINQLEKEIKTTACAPTESEGEE